MKTNRFIISLILVLMAVSFACSAASSLVATPTPVPTSTPLPTNTPLPSATPTFSPFLLDETEFGDTSCFRQAESDSEVERFVDGGEFHINVKTPSLSAWEFCENVPFDDFVVEAQATQLNGPDNNGYGLILRSLGDQFYLFLVGGDGYYSFVHYALSSEPEFIIDWTESTLVHKGNQTNQLKVEAVGSSFKLYINGEFVEETQDDRLTSGDVGFFVLASEEKGLDVAFDNLRVTAP